MNYPNLISIVNCFCHRECKWQGVLKCTKEKCPLHDFVKEHGKQLVKREVNN